MSTNHIIAFNFVIASSQLNSVEMVRKVKRWMHGKLFNAEGVSHGNPSTHTHTQTATDTVSDYEDKHVIYFFYLDLLYYSSDYQIEMA